MMHLSASIGNKNRRVCFNNDVHSQKCPSLSLPKPELRDNKPICGEVGGGKENLVWGTTTTTTTTTAAAAAAATMTTNISTLLTTNTNANIISRQNCLNVTTNHLPATMALLELQLEHLLISSSIRPKRHANLASTCTKTRINAPTPLLSSTINDVVENDTRDAMGQHWGLGDEWMLLLQQKSCQASSSHLISSLDGEILDHDDDDDDDDDDDVDDDNFDETMTMVDCYNDYDQQCDDDMKNRLNEPEGEFHCSRVKRKEHQNHVTQSTLIRSITVESDLNKLDGGRATSWSASKQCNTNSSVKNKQTCTNET